MDNDAKLRPLYLGRIFYERTDEDHWLTTNQLMTHEGQKEDVAVMDMSRFIKCEDNKVLTATAYDKDGNIINESWGTCVRRGEK